MKVRAFDFSNFRIFHKKFHNHWLKIADQIITYLTNALCVSLGEQNAGKILPCWWKKLSTNNIEGGITQGSCLRPLPFIIYNNDFERCLQGASPNMYADDLSITRSSVESDFLLRSINDEMTNIAERTRKGKYKALKLRSKVVCWQLGSWIIFSPNKG